MKIIDISGGGLKVVSKLELENAVRNREVEPINYCIYPEDENKIFLDTKKPENPFGMIAKTRVFSNRTARSWNPARRRSKQKQESRVTYAALGTRYIGVELW